MLNRRTAWMPLGCALLACKMANPAFEGGEETAADAGEDSSETKADSMGEGGTETLPSTSESTSSSSGDGDGDEFGDGDGDGDGDEFGDGDGDGDGDGEACVLPGPGPLRFKFHNQPSVGNCPELVDMDMRVSGPGPLGGIEVYECSEACGTCFGDPIELEAWPMELGDIGEMTQDECVRVRFEQHLGSSSTYCEYGRMIVTYSEDPGLMTPLVVATSVDGQDNSYVAELLMAANALPWAWTVGFECTCPKDDSDPCCLNSNPPSAYDLGAGQAGTVKPGEFLPLTITNIPYELHLRHAQVPDSCGAEFESSWLIRPAGF